MKNTAYGKTMENLRNRVNVRLVNNEKNFEIDIKIKFRNTKSI